MFINLPNLNDLIRQSRVRQDPYLITGYCTTGTRPDRNPKYKCYTPEHMFPGDVFPTYVGGPAYLMSRQAAVILYETALETPFFHLEDVFVTGIVAEEVGVPRRNAPEFRNNANPIPVAFLGCTLTR